MSIASSAAASVGDAANVHNAMPLALTSGALGSMPLWLPKLREVSEVAADLAPLVGVAIGLVTLARALKGSKPLEAKKKKSRFYSNLKETAADLSRKGGFVALIALTTLALVGLVVHFMKPRAETMPLAIISAPATARKKSADDAGDEGEGDLLQFNGAPPWFSALAALKGTHEGTARKPNPVVADLFKAGGFPQFKDQSGIAWCSIGLCGIFEKLGIPSAKTTMARGWLKWGAKLEKPRLGCVVVIARGNDGVSGHVGLYGGETATHIQILGCNQSDAITLANFRKSTTRVLGYRWPREIHELRTVKGGAVAAGGAIGSAVATTAVIADQLQSVQAPLANVGTPHAISLAAYIGLACAVLGAIGAIYAVYRRSKDFKEDGL